MPLSDHYSVVILGAGAAGLMAGIESAKRGRRTLVIDHAKKPAEKVRIAGGGRCNFTNLHTTPAAFLSRNPHFCKSALSQYTQYDFIAMVEAHNIAYHEKTLGQLFCDTSSKEIINMLLGSLDYAGGELILETSVTKINDTPHNGFNLTTTRGTVTCDSLIVATGGLSIPKMGATGFAYRIAEQYDMPLTETRAALVPFCFDADMRDYCKSLAGVSTNSIATFQKTAFKEAMLFTHRGLSGPAILQISSYWDHKNPVTLNLCPDTDIYAALMTAKVKTPTAHPVKILSAYLPRRLSENICEAAGHNGHNIAEMTDSALRHISDAVNAWQVTPDGTEGYRTAEVTLGGIDTNALSSKTMESKTRPNLYFIGECVDVTGHLGGYNFQWAWSSGYVAGQSA